MLNDEMAQSDDEIAESEKDWTQEIVRFQAMSDCDGQLEAWKDYGDKYHLANACRDLAPVAQLKKGNKLWDPLPKRNSKKSLRQNRTVRMADGGYVDNTAVANLLSHAQEKDDTLEEMDVVLLLHNTTPDYAPLGKTHPEDKKETKKQEKQVQEMPEKELPKDLRRLFKGYGPAEVASNGMRVKTTSCEVFESPNLSKVETLWKHFTQGNSMQFTKFANLKTVDNAAFGVKSGTRVNLSVWINQNWKSSPMPTTPKQMMVYKDVFEGTRSGVANSQGWAHLSEAFQVGKKSTKFVPLGLAISGGGWHSFTAAFGAFAGVLDTSADRDLHRQLSRVDYVSANSGGTWFLSCLAFSPDFNEQPQQKDRCDEMFGPQGYMGKLRKLFNLSSPPWNFHSLFKLPGLATRDWSVFNEQVVYAPVPDMQAKTLNSERQPWAQGKHLIFTSALILGKTTLVYAGTFLLGGGYHWYEVDSQETKHFAPFSIVVQPGRGGHWQILCKGDLHLKVSDNSWFEKHETVPLVKYYNAGDTPVIQVGTYSSAAAAAAASPQNYTLNNVWGLLTGGSEEYTPGTREGVQEALVHYGQPTREREHWSISLMQQQLRWWSPWLRQQQLEFEMLTTSWQRLWARDSQLSVSTPEALIPSRRFLKGIVGCVKGASSAGLCRTRRTRTWEWPGQVTKSLTRAPFVCCNRRRTATVSDTDAEFETERLHRELRALFIDAESLLSSAKSLQSSVSEIATCEVSWKLTESHEIKKLREEIGQLTELLKGLSNRASQVMRELRGTEGSGRLD